MHRLSDPTGGLPAGPGPDVPGDATLLGGVRAGSGAAYDVLVDRHRDAALHVATELVGASRAEPLVDLATQAVLTAIIEGGGPELAFRPYFLAAVVGTHVAGTATAFVAPRDPADIWRDGSATGTAMAGLPEQTRLLLWHLSVEGERPVQVAPLLAVPTGHVPALLARARAVGPGDRLGVGSVLLGDAAAGCFGDRTAYARPRGRGMRTAAAVGAVALIGAGAVTAALGHATTGPATTATGAPTIAIVPAPARPAGEPPAQSDVGAPATAVAPASPGASGSATDSVTPTKKSSERSRTGLAALGSSSPSSAPSSTAPAAPTSPTSPTTADVAIAARSSSGTVSWSVSGLPTGASSIVTIAAETGMTLRPDGVGCSTDDPRMMTCTVTAGEPGGSFVVDDPIGGGQVSLSVQPVSGLDDPASGNNDATVSP